MSAQLQLIATDWNFHWPGKVQALVHRIFDLRRTFSMRRNQDPVSLSPSRIDPMFRFRLEELIGVWFNRLMREFPNFSYRFEKEPNIFLGYSEEEILVLNLEVFTGIFYSIRINLNKNKDECCDVSSSRWSIRGVNIFDIKYVNEIFVTNHDGTRRAVDGSGDIDEVGRDNYLGGVFRTVDFPGDNFSVPNFDLKSSPAFSEAIINAVKKEEKEEEKPKESKEFTDLKNTIFGMSSVIKDLDNERDK